ncbi:Attachment mediating protein VirB1 (plasmid) [Roseomonas mucosa]|uniref:lytic transglycosylase domain-containing protein n=1 Tax=Roseomonas mucosa TaxID=207340 RepID=UPI002245E0E5|nr:lytic transglycosylase domain-containing protein [Roseomonas mucosa]UZO95032.1 Attachment mediating protein VirB1 [Roseomonas mucosa]
MILTLAAFAQIAAACGSSVHVDTLAAIARTESQFNTLAIGDNTTGRSYAPTSPEQAIATATTLLAQGHSIDMGLMQVNSANLRGLRMSVADAFDACKSVAGGARVLVEGYRAPGAGQDTQPALLRALSHYNTGSQQRGFTNGYVRRVQVSAQEVVPAIRLGGPGGPVVVGPEGGSEAAAPPPPPPAPPSWDVYGNARYRRENGGVIFAPRPAPAAPAPSAPAAPVPTQTPLPAPQEPVQLQATGSVAFNAR